jgi:hypothetical protein
VLRAIRDMSRCDLSLLALAWPVHAAPAGAGAFTMVHVRL